LKTEQDMIQNQTGIAFDIKKFAIHDGPGIRTTVFLKGCPLKCIWCHNPESIEPSPEIFYSPDKCIGCMTCFRVCPNHCHTLQEQTHVYARERCVRCGACTSECYAEALELIGRVRSVEDIIAEVLQDEPFYETSHGGMTISGGEPMFQFGFTRELLRSAKEKRLHTCLDTSGIAPFDRYRHLLELTDIFLYDLKETDPEKHLKYTGVPNALILDNLIQIDACGSQIILRCPIIPGLNDREDHFAEIAAWANRLRHVLEVNVLPYHPLGTSKNERIGKSAALKKLSFPEENTVNSWIQFIQKGTDVQVRRS